MILMPLKYLCTMSQSNATKLHPLLVRAVAQALHTIFKENRHADKVIEQTLKQNPKAGSRDRAFIAETTYDVVRYYRLYCELLGRTPITESDFWELIGIHLLVPTASAAEASAETAVKADGICPIGKNLKA